MEGELRSTQQLKEMNMDKQSKVESEDTLVFEMGAVSEETKGIDTGLFEHASTMPGPLPQ
jgi:hypothetical protein